MSKQLLFLILSKYNQYFGETIGSWAGSLKRSSSDSWPLHADSDIGAEFCSVSNVAEEVDHNQIFIISFRFFHAFIALLLFLYSLNKNLKKRVENVFLSPSPPLLGIFYKENAKLGNDLFLN